MRPRSRKICLVAALVAIGAVCRDGLGLVALGMKIVMLLQEAATRPSSLRTNPKPNQLA